MPAAGAIATLLEAAGEVARKRRGEFFGEQALLHDAPRNATITADGGPVVCLELSRTVFEQYVSHMARIELLLAQIPLLAGIEQERRLQLAAAMTLVEFKHGAPIIEQDDIGDCLYMVEEGECVVSVFGAGEVGRLNRGKFFGEQALLHDEPRNATVRAVGWVKCFELKRKAFEELIMVEMEAAAQVELFLAQVPLLARLDPNRRMQLVKVMREREYKDGESIVRVGEKGASMFIITEGAVQITSMAGQELAKKRRGDYFGELSLLSPQYPRQEQGRLQARYPNLG